MLRYAIVGVLAFCFTLSAFLICILEMPGEQSVSIVGGSILQLNQGGYSAFHKNSGWKKYWNGLPIRKPIG